MDPSPQVPCHKESVSSSGTNTTTKDETAWQDLRLSEKLCEILKIDSKVDCKFVVGPETETAEIIFGHKWMFAVESPVFERMFCGDFLEAKDGVTIRLPDDDPNAFRNLRRMIYNTRPCEFDILSFEELIELYKICDKYIIKSISKLCVTYIEEKFFENIAGSQLITLFGVATELQNLDFLKVVKEVKLLSFKYPLIPDLNNLIAAHFVEYIQLHVHNVKYCVDHLHLFEAIETYLTHHELIPQNLLNENGNNGTSTTVEDFHEKETKSSLLERLLACVDFGPITTDDFLAGPGVSKILTWQQKYFILSQLATIPCETCEGGQDITIKLFVESESK